MHADTASSHVGTIQTTKVYYIVVEFELSFRRHFGALLLVGFVVRRLSLSESRLTQAKADLGTIS
jgi:hypothetical protein